MATWPRLFLQAFPANSDTEAQQAGRRIIGTRVFNWENWTWANMQAQDRRSRRLFLSLQPRSAEADHRRPRRSFARHRRVSHGRNSLRVPDARCPVLAVAGRGPRAVRHDGRVLDELRRLGNPNGPGLPAWPRFDPQQPTTLHFSDGIHVGAVPDMATLRILDRLRPADSKGRRSVTAATSNLSKHQQPARNDRMPKIARIELDLSRIRAGEGQGLRQCPRRQQSPQLLARSR